MVALCIFICFSLILLSCRYIRPQFFYNNPLLSFIQFVIGPYTDDLGNVLPYAVEGVGVPVDPLAFAGLLGKSTFLICTIIYLSKSFECKNYYATDYIIAVI